MQYRSRVWMGAVASALVGALLSFHAVAQKRYDPGASDTEIKIGKTWALIGPVASEAYQTKVHAAYFQRLNEKGSIDAMKEM